MSKGIFIKTRLGKILFRVSVILIGIAAIAAGSFSLAKYVYTNKSSSEAGVAIVGVEEYGLVNPWKNKTAWNLDYTKVVPGADIPGPHISLKIDSEVSWSLYIKVTHNGMFGTEKKKDIHGNEVWAIQYKGVDAIYYSVDPQYWEVVDEAAGVYKYIVNGDPYNPDYIFSPTKPHNYTGDNEIPILLYDSIIVSQNYNYDHNATADYIDFSLSFETYIRQVLN